MTLEITVNVFHHLASVGPVEEILNLLRDIKASQGEFRMALSQDFLDLSRKIDDATTAVAARIAALSGQIKNSMTDAEVAAVKTSLQAEADRLTVLGSDPNNPVPPAP